jgi:hypothetical protein
MKFLALVVALAGLSATACGQQPTPVSADGDAVRERAQEAQTARRRTGAELQDRALNRVIRTVYLCDNSERLSVDFDNPRRMATVRNSSGEAVDLFQERATEGIWYKASGYELRGEGAMATWASDGRPPTSCRALD